MGPGPPTKLRYTDCSKTQVHDVVVIKLHLGKAHEPGALLLQSLAGLQRTDQC